MMQERSMRKTIAMNSNWFHVDVTIGFSSTRVFLESKTKTSFYFLSFWNVSASSAWITTKWYRQTEPRYRVGGDRFVEKLDPMAFLLRKARISHCRWTIIRPRSESLCHALDRLSKIRGRLVIIGTKTKCALGQL